jgi:hypothetical protein
MPDDTAATEEPQAPGPGTRTRVTPSPRPTYAGATPVRTPREVGTLFAVAPDYR